MESEGRMPYVKFLDGLRCLAVSWVFLFHLQVYLHIAHHGIAGLLASRGWMGVDLFFVISGFLITTILLREHAATGMISLRKFYMRRTLRIWPVYYLMVGAVLLVAFIARNVEGAGPGTDLVFSTIQWPAMYLTDAYVAYANTEHCALLHTWSLAVEEQFYLLWPLLLFWNVKWAKRFAIAAIIGIALWRTWLTFHLPVGAIAMRRTYYAPDTRMDQIMYGAVLAFIMLNAGQRIILGRIVRLRVAQAAAVATFLAAVYLNVRWSGHVGNAIGYSMSGLSMAFGIAYLLIARPRWIFVLESRPVVYIGKISYGMYLFSPFVIGFVRYLLPARPTLFVESAACVLAYAATILIAGLSHAYFEAPFLKLKRRFSSSGESHAAARQPGAVPTL